MKKTQQLLKAGILVLGLSLVSLPLAYAATETDTTAENAVETTADNVQDTTRGFDDWGLFGLLGLLGLLGLRGGNRNVVVDGTRK